MINVGTAGQHAVHQRQHLTARQRPTDTATKTHHGIDQHLKAKSFAQRGWQQQAPVDDQILIVEGRFNPVKSLRHPAHWKCLLGLLDNSCRETLIVPAQETFHPHTRPTSPQPDPWIKA